VYDNIALPLSYHSNISPEEIEEKVDQKLEDFGLKALRDALPVRLSTGQKKLVGMARTLVIEPELIFFDEPVTGVDALSREKVFNAVLQLQGDPNITLVSVSHNLDFIKRYADYIALIYDKRLFAYGQKDEILKSNDPILQQILSVIVDEESVIADQVLGLLTGEE
jgi:phospholipid/cholesterol/gamma-HCH transport system ATP-binding protein